MKLAIMQPYLFPYIGYWQLIGTVDTFVIYDDVNYIKQGYINRNTILINAQRHLFTLELIKASPYRQIAEIEVGQNKNKLLKTISQAYAKAPYFDAVYPLIENIMTQNEKNLAKFIGYSLFKVSEYLGINTQFIYSSDIEKDNSLKAQDKIIDICLKLGATDYINAIGGEVLYDRESFLQEGLNLSFLQPEIKEYGQFKNEFIPYLSIIDIMMFNSKEEIKIMMCEYVLV